MVNKKLLISFLLILLVAVSVSSVSAADDADAIVADDAVIDDAVTAQTIVVDGDDDVAVNTALEEAQTGTTIDLGKDKNYTFNSYINVTKQVTFKGDNVIINANGSQMADGVVQIYSSGAGTVISGIAFNNIDDADNYLYKYNGKLDEKGKSVSTAVGTAVTLYSAADNVIITDCVFNNWFNHAVYINNVNFATVQNSQFYGGSATFINNIPDGPKDRGTYHISVMGSTGTWVSNCTFAGTVCDGVSIAGSSYDSTVIGNSFYNNAFSIYFGGKSTEGTLIQGNTFVNCGWFESAVYDEEGETGEYVSFYDLPVISVQKSSDSFVINNNTFYARNANVLIKALEGSTAHGGASNIGNITITNNKVIGLDQYYIGSEKIIMPSVTLVYIETYNDVIRPTGEILIAGNTLNGARAATYWTQKWGDNYGNVSIKAAMSPTVVLVTSVKDETIIGLLKDYDDKVLAGEELSFSSEGNSGTVETDKNGIFIIENVTGLVTMSYAGDGEKFLPSESTIDVPVSTSIYTVIAINSLSDETIKGTLKDIYGQGLAGQNISYFYLDGDGVVETESDGTFTIENITGAVGLRFITTGKYIGSDAAVEVAEKVVPVQQNTTMIIPDVTGIATENIVVKVNLSTNGKALANENVTLVINGKIISGLTDKNGIFTTSEGKYRTSNTFVISAYYAGNATQKSAFATGNAKIAKKNVVLTAPNYTFTTKQIKRVIVYLKDKKGNIIKNKELTLKLKDGTTLTATTLSNGGALFKVPISKAGTYTYGVYCYTDSSYQGVYASGKIVVK